MNEPTEKSATIRPGLALITAISSIMNTDISLEQLFSTICQLAVLEMGVNSSFVGQFSKQTESLKYITVDGRDLSILDQKALSNKIIKHIQLHPHPESAFSLSIHENEICILMPVLINKALYRLLGFISDSINNIKPELTLYTMLGQLTSCAGTRIVIQNNSQEILFANSHLYTLGELSSSIAHEINQPLNVIAMITANARKKILNNRLEPDYLLKKISRIEAQVRRATLITQQIGWLSRFDQHTGNLFNSYEVICQSLDLIGQQFKVSNIEIINNCVDNVIRVKGSAVRLAHIILNILTLLRNQCRLHQVKDMIITFSTQVLEKMLQIQILTSLKLPDEMMSMPFEFKAETLGLFSSYHYCINLQGKLWIDEQHNGTLFTITLPAYPSL